MIKSRVKIKHFSIVGLMSPGWVRTHSDFCWTHGLGLGLWPTGLGLGLGLWSDGLGLGLGLWSSGLGLTPDGLGLWPDGLGLGLGLWPCGLGLTAGLTSPDSLQHCIKLHRPKVHPRKNDSRDPYYLCVNVLRPRARTFIFLGEFQSRFVMQIFRFYATYASFLHVTWPHMLWGVCVV